MTFFGLKQGQDLENRAAHPHQEFQGVPPSLLGESHEAVLWLGRSEKSKMICLRNFLQTVQGP